MADVYLFVSGATNNARIALVALDTGINDWRIDVIDATNGVPGSKELTSADIVALKSMWNRESDRIYQLDTAFGVAISGGESFTFTNTSVLSDSDAATDEVALTVAQTAAMMTWIQMGFTNP